MEKEKDAVQDDDRYYAILLMDGDHMGRLVNGETLASTWQSVLHPKLVSRLRDKEFDQKYRKFWEHEMNRVRFLSPSVHATISEALGGFSLYTVPSVVKKHRGRLIYAGGDDLCAVFPASTALQAAREIAETYSQGFIVISDRKDTRNLNPVEKAWQPTADRLALHLGKGVEISISAGILFAHHKKPLTAAMREVHQLLNRAKNQGGRNGVAIELEKRSGGGRLFMAGWGERPFKGLSLGRATSSLEDDYLLDHFLEAAKAMGTPGKRSMSVLLVYRLEQLRPGLEAILKSAPEELVKFLSKQMEKSGKRKDKEIVDPLAYRIAALIARKGQGAGSLRIDTDSLIIAKFIGARIARVEGNQGGVS
jgi:CRISPR-associated protein Cmr2